MNLSFVNKYLSFMTHFGGVPVSTGPSPNAQPHRPRFVWLICGLIVLSVLGTNLVLLLTFILYSLVTGALAAQDFLTIAAGGAIAFGGPLWYSLHLQKQGVLR
jgi:hypothetical protein